MAQQDRKKRRRRSSGGFLDIVNGLLMLVVFGLIAVIGVFLWGVTQFYAEGPTQEEESFFVERGSGLGLVAQRLENQGLISSATIFQASGWAMRKQTQLRPGEFRIPAQASMSEILTLLTEGRPIEYFVMVRPGQSSYEVMTALNDPAHNLTGDPIEEPPPEGSVLPVRHDYFPRDDRGALLRLMQEEMERTVDRLWNECRPDVCGPEGVLEDKRAFVTLASIVEKETGLAAERTIVASLFVNRLKRGMPLQTDPTILYGLYRGVPQERLVITRSQLSDTSNPYNTYVIRELPPTPIANPGVAAMEAVANPADTNYLYMVAVTPGNYNDGHYFAETLEEHNRNVARYRVQEREQAQQAAEEAAAAEAEAAEAEAAGNGQ